MGHISERLGLPKSYFPGSQLDENFERLEWELELDAKVSDVGTKRHRTSPYRK